MYTKLEDNMVKRKISCSICGADTFKKYPGLHGHVRFKHKKNPGLRIRSLAANIWDGMEKNKGGKSEQKAYRFLSGTGMPKLSDFDIANFQWGAELAVVICMFSTSEDLAYSPAPAPCTSRESKSRPNQRSFAKPFI